MLSDASIYFEIFYAVICLSFQTLLKQIFYKNVSGMRSSIVNLKVEKCPSHEVKRTN